MATLEQVEKLRQRANVSYDDAKQALEASGGDLLDAMIYLEKNGKVTPPTSGGAYSSKGEPVKDNTAAYDQAEDADPPGESVGTFFRKLWNWFLGLLRRGNKNHFDVWQKDNTLLSVPVTLLVVLLICAFWIVVPLLVVGLFCGCRYRFRGPDLGKPGVNNVMETAERAADNIKSEVFSGEEKQ